MMHKLKTYWILLTVILIAYSFGSDGVKAAAIFVAYLNAIFTLAAAIDHSQACQNAVTSLETMRGTPRCGTIWNRKGPIL